MIVNFKGNTLTYIIVYYNLTNVSDQNEIYNFYENLATNHVLFDLKIPTHNMLIVIWYFNEHLRPRDEFKFSSQE